MSIWRTGCGVALAVATIAATGTVAEAQDKDTLARAKDFYASAAYEDALQVIERLRGTEPAAQTSEVAAYQVFCLVALGRTDQAKRAIEAMVRLDPMYHPPEALASPRVRTLYEDTRRPLLPQLARQSYAKAKGAFDKKDLPTAGPEFDRAIALMDELSDADDPTLADLRTLATGFRDLCKAPPPAPTPVRVDPPHPDVAKPADDSHPASPGGTETAPAPAAPPTTAATAPKTPPATAAASNRDMVYAVKDTDVKPPVAISREMPAWHPANAFESHQLNTGIIEVIVAEDGSVSSATIRKSAAASYDAPLLKAAAGWKFKPATKDGVAVTFRLEVSVQLGR